MEVLSCFEADINLFDWSVQTWFLLFPVTTQNYLLTIYFA